MKKNQEKKYCILCKVSGGITGSRSGLLKENGKIVFFDDFDLAEIEAKKLTQQMNNSRSIASFSYQSILYVD